MDTAVLGTIKQLYNYDLGNKRENKLMENEVKQEFMINKSEPDHVMV